MGLITFVQGISFFISLLLIPLLCRNHNLGLWIAYLFLCSFLTPVIGYPIYKTVFDRY